MTVYRYTSQIVRFIAFILGVVISNYASVCLLQEQWNPLCWSKWGLAWFIFFTTAHIHYKIRDDIKARLESEIGERNHSLDALIDKMDYLNSVTIELNNKQRAEIKKLKSN